MKKFVGYVNGKEFSSEEKFTEAVKATIASGESPMMISSYYKECNCGGENGCNCGADHKAVEVKDEKQPLDMERFILNGDCEKYEDGSYVIPTNIDVLFKDASNKGEIEQKLESLITSKNKEQVSISKELNKLNIESSNLKNKIDTITKDREDAEHQINYYSRLLRILNGDEKKDVNKNTNNNNKVFATNSLKKDTDAYDVIIDVIKGFDKYLKDVGFWKK